MSSACRSAGRRQNNHCRQTRPLAGPRRKKKVLTVSCDVYRPAAIDQLKAVTEQAGADWFPSHTGEKPLDIAAAAVSEARRRFMMC